MILIPKISVITPTIRSRGLSLVNKALNRQTFPKDDFEWIVVSPNTEKMKMLFLPFHWVREPEKANGDVWCLNKAYNAALSQVKGELVISWQDYTFADPDCLEKFWFHYQQEPKTIVGAVGNKYKDTSWTTMTWKDPRERSDQGSYYPCFWNDIEANLCAVPKKAFEAVGGFLEEMDKYYGLDFFSVVNRLNDLGDWEFKLDQTIKSYSLEHGRLSKDWDEKNWMKDNRYNELVARLKAERKWPKASYLQIE